MKTKKKLKIAVVVNRHLTLIPTILIEEVFGQCWTCFVWMFWSVEFSYE